MSAKPMYCGACGAPEPKHWPDCPIPEEQAAGIEVIKPPDVFDPSPAAAFDAIAAMPGAVVQQESDLLGICPSCLDPVVLHVDTDFVQKGSEFFHGACWDDRLVEKRGYE